MKLVARSLACLLPLVLSACVHSTNQAQMQWLAPPIEDTPPPPDISPSALPAPELKIPKTPEPVAIPPEPVKTVPKHHHPTVKPVNGSQAPATTPATGQPPATVAESAPAEVSAGGNFETAVTPDLKKEAEAAINEVERGLNGLGRKLSDQEEKTSDQIREYLKQARTDLTSGDVEAASTLAKKAKALLGELSP